MGAPNGHKTAAKTSSAGGGSPSVLRGGLARLQAFARWVILTHRIDAGVGVLASDWLPQVQAMVLATALPWLENTTSSRYGYGFIGVYLAHVKTRRGCRGSKRD